MTYRLKWTARATTDFAALRAAAEKAQETRKRTGKTKASRQEGLFKQVAKTVQLLTGNPRHPGLNAHKFSSLPNPYDGSKPVFEVYAQNKTPGAYRVFFCYGPEQDQITLIAITPHP